MPKDLTVTITYGTERHEVRVPVDDFTDARLDRLHELVHIIAGRARREGRGRVAEEHIELLQYEQAATLRRLDELAEVAQ